MKKVVFSMILAVGLFPAFAQNDTQTPALTYPSSVGVFGSTAIGGGLSYQRWFDRFGCAVTVGGNITPYLSTGSTSWGNSVVDADFYAWNYDVELDFMYRLYSSVFADWLTGDLFAYAMAAHMGGAQVAYVPNADASKQGTYAEGNYVPVMAAGIGIGYEIILFRHFSIPAQFGYAAQWPLRLDFTVSGGLRYRF
jgi:hypothetical protein